MWKGCYIAILLTWQAVSGIKNDNPWDQYILAPVNRTILPSGIHQTSNQSGTALRDTTLSGPGSSVTFDFGKIVAGVLTINYGAESSCNRGTCNSTGLPYKVCSSAPCEALGIGFSESELYIGVASDDSTLFGFHDGVLYAPILSGQPYTLPSQYSRGSFRYVTLSLGPDVATSTTVQIAGISVEFDAEPSVSAAQLRNYTGHFYSSDDLLNKIWYAGVYTGQICTVGAGTGVNHSWALTGGGWGQGELATGLGESDEYLADGGKRDRNPWSGDLESTLLVELMARNYDNLKSGRNALTAMLSVQNNVTGYFPYAGSALANILLQYGAVRK